MKIPTPLFAISLALAACSGLAQNTNPDNNGSSTDLGSDIRDGKTNKIARIFKVTPTHVFVIYEGNTGGRNIPREELPEQLQARFPYDAGKASDFSMRQAQTAALQAAAQQTIIQESQLRRARQIESQIATLSQRDAELQKLVNVYHRMPPGNGRKVRLAHMLDEQQSIREQVIKLRQQLLAVR